MPKLAGAHTCSVSRRHYRSGDGRPDARTHRTGNDVVGGELVFDEIRDGLGCRKFHSCGDARRPGVQNAAEDAGEGQYVVDLIGKV